MEYSASPQTSYSSFKRPLAFLSACFACLNAGTIYAWSAYSSPLAKKLQYNQKDAAMVAAAGAYGLFLMGVVFGPLVDNPRIGPRRVCLLGGCLLFIGYFLLAQAYRGNLTERTPPFLSALFLLLAGTGSSACNISSLATVARSFPEATRGAAMSVPLGLVGLSAFIYSTINSIFMHFHIGSADPTYTFLLFLAFFTGLGNILASYGLMIVPATRAHLEVSEEIVASDAVDATLPEPSQTVTENSPLLRSSGRARSASLSDLRRANPPPTILNGFKRVFKDNDSRIFFCILFLVAGTGLSYITSVGEVVELLYENEKQNGQPLDVRRRGTLLGEPGTLQKLQSGHVALFSLTSFTGRIFFGSVSDVARRKGCGRGVCLLIAASALAATMAVASSAFGGTLDRLWAITAIIGLSYGAIFGVSPPLVGEEIIGGVHHFGRNWGVLSWAPPFGNQAFSYIFGCLLDAHTSCHGYQCYALSFGINALACMIGVGLLFLFQNGYQARRSRRLMEAS